MIGSFQDARIVYLGTDESGHDIWFSKEYLISIRDHSDHYEGWKGTLLEESVEKVVSSNSILGIIESLIGDFSK
jgi:hypothetical protein